MKEISTFKCRIFYLRFEFQGRGGGAPAAKALYCWPHESYGLLAEAARCGGGKSGGGRDTIPAAAGRAAERRA